ncbi:hypothetical protein AWU65_28160 [Paenibacillus glucanolyticus]|uniref:Uncharacterized protein n=1 Tax=Paenibacillus glucanolyticus TaxID=59843 RepID=A0A163EQT2_9BACL|nr:hypothetical protein [Paenibacillus glucanolyticus]KZS43953.1 hypothetical protein AWU65_28160 [Paenibacillus glucanolyticus]
MLIRTTQEKYRFMGGVAMANKFRFSGINSLGSNQVRLEGEQSMPEHPQSENEQISIEYQAEEVQVHKETGREQTQQEKQVSVMEESTPTEAANENSNEKPIIQEKQEIVPEQGDSKHQQEDSSQQDANAQELKQELNDGNEERLLAIEDIVKPGKFGVTNNQMIPAIKQVIAEGSVEKLRMLRSIYLYSFENSLRYLKKSEREFIQKSLK